MTSGPAIIMENAQTIYDQARQGAGGVLTSDERARH